MSAFHVASQIREFSKETQAVAPNRDTMMQVTLCDEYNSSEESPGELGNGTNFVWVHPSEAVQFSLPEDWSIWRENNYHHVEPKRLEATSSLSPISLRATIGVDDCTELRSLDAPSVLFNLRRRFLGDAIYDTDENCSPPELNVVANPRKFLSPQNKLKKEDQREQKKLQRQTKKSDTSPSFLSGLVETFQTCPTELSKAYRQREALIYTFAGSVLLAINPYRVLPHLVCEETLKKYQGSLSKENPPHPFAVAERCLRRLERTKASQTVVISGDSGAGKMLNISQARTIHEFNY